MLKLSWKKFKRFRSFSVPLYKDLNVIVGENESGKSTILSAINYVLGGNRNKIEAVGFDKLISTQAVQEFLASDKKYEDLPRLRVELYLNEQNNIDLKVRIIQMMLSAMALRWNAFQMMT